MAPIRCGRLAIGWNTRDPDIAIPPLLSRHAGPPGPSDISYFRHRRDRAAGAGWPAGGFVLKLRRQHSTQEFVLSLEPRNFGGGPRPSRNVFGGTLETCSLKPMTGFFRNGCCDTGEEDIGSHTVCVVVTAEFLEFSREQGNDLSTPAPAFGFAGLKPGDRWCLCAPRWQEAFLAKRAPRVVLRATHEGALAYCSLADLKSHTIDLA